MLGDGVCDTVCANSACEFDRGDCNLCSPGCFPALRGNGVCDEECRTTQCNYDDSDCDCAPGCTSTLLANAVCDSACDSAACEYDSHRCVRTTQGDCASGCFAAMLGNSHCDSECNNAGCEWDRLDCGCAPGCSFTDLEKCKVECMALDCGYGKYPGYRQCFYFNSLLRFRHYQIFLSLQNRFFPQVSLDALCGIFDCNYLSSDSPSTSCIRYCFAHICVKPSQSCTSPIPLEHCSTGANDKEYPTCFECTPPYVNSAGRCLPACDPGLHPHPIVTDLCVPDADSTTAENPRVLYVRAGSDGDGSWDRPFSTLAEALTHATARYNSVFLVGPDHSFSCTHVSGVMARATVALPENDLRNRQLRVLITAYCKECERPVLWVEPTDPAILIAPGVRLKTEFCDHAEFGELAIEHIVFRARVKEYCIPSYSALIRAAFNTVKLVHVTFQDFCGYLALVQVYTQASLTLTDVDFLNVTGSSYIIYQRPFVLQCEVPSWRSQANFTYTGGAVEMRRDAGLRPLAFMNMSELAVARISDVSFTWEANSSFSLLFFSLLLQLEILRCEFLNSSFPGSLLLMEVPAAMKFYEEEMLQPSDVYTTVAPFPNILIESCLFRNNSVHADLYFSYTTVRQSILINNCSFVREWADTAVRSTHTKLVDLISIYGPAVYVGNQRIRLQKPNFQLMDCVFLENHGAAIDIDRAAHVLLSNVNVSKSAVQIALSYNVTLDSCHFKDASIRLTDISWQTHLNNSEFVQTALFLTNTDRIVLRKVAVRNCTNPDSPAGTVSASSASVEVLESAFIGNAAGLGGALYVFESAEVAIAGCLFVENSARLSGGAVFVQVSNTAVALADSEFHGNAADRGGAVYFEGESLVLRMTAVNMSQNSAIGSAVFIAEVEMEGAIETCEFIRNDAEDQGALALFYLSGQLTISNSLFTANTGKQQTVIYAAYDAENAALNLNSLYFSRNIGETLVHVPFKMLQSKLFSQNLTFELNVGICLSLENAVADIEDCSFIRNSAPSAPAVFIRQGSTVRMLRVNFTANIADIEAGAVGVTESSQTDCQLCAFRSNVAGEQAGALSVQKGAVVNLSDCLFDANIAKQEAAAIAFFSAGDSSISSSLFVNNRAGGNAVISLLTSAVVMAACTVQENWSGASTPGVTVALSNLTLHDCVFRDQSGVSGTMLSVTMLSMLKANNCEFRDSVAKDIGAIDIENSVADIRNSNLTNSTAALGSSIFALGNSKLTLFHLSLSTHSNSEGGALHFLGVSAELSQVHFTSTTGSAIYAQEAAVSVADSEFSDGRAHSGPGLLCSKCSSLTVLRTRFLGMQAAAGAVWIEGVLDYTNFTIAQSTFLDNVGQDYGALYLADVSITVRDSLFRNNSAAHEKGEGGAVSLLCSLPKCAFTLSRNVFEGNYATLRGGAVSWEDSEPSLSDNSYKDNIALYGPDIAARPSRVTLVSASLDAVASGQVLSPLVFQVLDQYGARVTSDNSSRAEISSAQEVSGSIEVTAKQGLFAFDSVTLTATPGTEITIFVNLKGTTFSLPLQVKMRECEVGESETQNQCVTCESGTYSFSPRAPCQACPPQAICYGNITVVPRAGYWRARQLSEKFFSCPNRKACVESMSLTGACATGYRGNMCQTCALGYSRSKKIQCDLCPNSSSNVLKVVGFSLLTVFIGVVLVNASIKSAYKSKSEHSIYLKILMNYLQLVMLLGSFNLSWPTLTKALLDVQENAGSFTEQLFAFECLDEHYDENSFFYRKVLVMSFVPLMCLGASTVVWVAIAALKRAKSLLVNELVASSIVLFFLVHPSIIKVMFHTFNCEEIEDNEYWVHSYQLRCWCGSHWKYSLGVALPSLVVWGAGVPTVVLVLLIRQRKRLQDLPVRIRFGFLFNGFSDQRFYWEFVTVYRKLLIVSVAVFLSRTSLGVQALLVLAVLVVSAALHQNYHPYTQVHMNVMEARSLTVSVVTVMCGIVFLDGVGRRVQTVCEVAIVLVNVYFLQAWVKGMFSALLILLLKKLRFLQRYFYVMDGRVRTMARVWRMLTSRSQIALQTTMPPASRSLYLARLYKQLETR